MISERMGVKAYFKVDVLSRKTNIMLHFKSDLSLNPSPKERDFAGYKVQSYTTLFNSIYLFPVELFLITICL